MVQMGLINSVRQGRCASDTGRGSLAKMRPEREPVGQCNVGTLKRRTRGAPLDESTEHSAPGKHRNISTAHMQLSAAVQQCSLQQMRRFPNCRAVVSFLVACSSCSSAVILSYYSCTKPCHVRRIGASMPSQGHNDNSSMRLLIRRSANNQRGGASNPQALGVQVASSLSCFNCCK